MYTLKKKNYTLFNRKVKDRYSHRKYKLTQEVNNLN